MSRFMMLQHPPWLIIVLTTIFLYTMAWFSLSTLTFFASDNGLRFLQIQSLIEQKWQTFAIDYPAYFVDPTFQHVPYYTAYLVIDDQLYLSLTPWFNLLVSWCYAILGLFGLPIIPVLGSIMAGLAIFYLIQTTDLPYLSLAFLTTIVATPLFFYSLELWDHSLAVGIGTIAVYYITISLQKTSLSTNEISWHLPLFGGIILGLATCLRAEMNVFAVAIGLSLLLFQWKIGIVTTMGGLLGALPGWLLQYYWYGHPFAPVVSHRLMKYGHVSYPFRDRAVDTVIEKGRLLTLVESGDMISFVATLLVTIGLVSFILILRRKQWQHPLLLIVSGFLLLSGYLIFCSIAWNKPLSGLLPTIPLLALSASYLNIPAKQPIYYHFLMVVTFGFIALMLLLWPTFGGLQWGARYMAPAYPLLVYLAFYHYQAYSKLFSHLFQRRFQQITIMLFGLSILLQLLGVRLLYLKHAEQLPYMADIKAISAEFILTNAPYFPSMMVGAGKRNFIYVQDDADLAIMLQRLAEQGVVDVAILPLNGFPLTVPQQIGEFQLQAQTPQLYTISK